MAQATQAAKKSQSAAPSTAADWQRQGNALIDEGQVDRAITAFRRALRLDDSLAEVHNDLGAAYFKKQWYAEAEECFRKAIERDPRHGVAHANRGAALRALGRLNESRSSYQRALWYKLLALVPRFLRGAPPRKAPGAAGIGPALEPIRQAMEQGKAQRAVELADEVLRRHPEEPDALHASALAREANRDYDQAAALARKALERRADRSEFYITLARLLSRAGDYNAALNAATTALRLEPGAAGIHATIAGIFHPWRDDLAEQAARHAVELDAKLPLAHANLAAALWGQGRLDEAERAIREAMRLDPKHVPFKVSLGMILKDMDRTDEARAIYRELMAHAPDHGKVCLDVGMLAMESDRDLATARDLYRKAQHSADEPRAYVAEALLDFLEGRFEAGWPKYEKRKQLSDQRMHHDHLAAVPDWDGTPLAQGKLLVYGEQGLGDEIMFASLLPDLLREAGSVALLCEPRLGRLFARSFPAIEVLAEPRQAQPERVARHGGIRCKIAAGSLGARYRRAPGDFPQHRGYLAADAQKVQAWRERLGPPDGRLRAALSWKGGLQRTGRGRRSITLAQLEPLLSLPGVAWVSVQHEDDSADERIRRFPGVTQDMDDLASLIGALDLVVSVCNTNVHVAGALGKEVLVMAPFVPEWRYGVSGERMVWYPSARVFRQSSYRRWEEVIERVRQTILSKGRQ